MRTFWFAVVPFGIFSIFWAACSNSGGDPNAVKLQQAKQAARQLVSAAAVTR